jgi:predicted enzyme related to lactoylglutathione lyase
MGRVIHFELNADDPERAAQFYRRVFGWTIDKWDGPEDYWLVTTGPESEPGIGGAITSRMGPGITTVNTVDVDDLDAALERAGAAGGTVVLPKMIVPGVGFLAYIKDTEGNIVGLMQADPAAAPSG